MVQLCHLPVDALRYAQLTSGPEPTGRTRPLPEIPSPRLAYAVVFVAYYSAIAALYSWREIVDTTTDTALSTATAILTGIGPLVLLAGTLTALSVEVIMLVEHYLRRRMEKALNEQQAKWESWNARRMEAEEEGRPFDEPPPSGRSKNGARSR